MKEQIIKALESELDTAWDVNGHLVYVIYDEDIPDVASKIEPLINQEVERRIKERMNEDKEPYMGWCEVNGCNNEGASGGCYWSDTGYWTICSKHGEDCRNGLPQPKMKVEAVEREKNRDPQTGFLRSRLTPQVQKTEGGQ